MLFKLRNRKMENQGFTVMEKGIFTTQLALSFALLLVSAPASAFHCSLFEGATTAIPSFKTEIAELKNMDQRGRHIKVLVPRQGPVQEFNLSDYIASVSGNAEVKKKLAQVAGGTVVYIDLFPVEKRYEIRMGLLTTNLEQVIKPTVYANFAYNTQHNEVYDLQSKIAVFCNWSTVIKAS